MTVNGPSGTGNPNPLINPGSITGNRHAMVYLPQGPPLPEYGMLNPDVMLHEIGHTLGAVYDGAPHASGGGHCFDEEDVMCYADGGPRGQASNITHTCPTTAYQPYASFDCGGDDYFNPTPAPGSYLDTHWNLFNSSFLAYCTELAQACDGGLPYAPAPVTQTKSGPLRVVKSRKGRPLERSSTMRFSGSPLGMLALSSSVTPQAATATLTFSKIKLPKLKKAQFTVLACLLDIEALDFEAVVGAHNMSFNPRKCSRVKTRKRTLTLAPLTLTQNKYQGFVVADMFVTARYESAHGKKMRWLASTPGNPSQLITVSATRDTASP